MRSLTRIARPESPAVLADLIREANATPESIPFDPEQRYQRGLDGSDPNSIPVPPATNEMFDSEPLNSPRNLARMAARELGLDDDRILSPRGVPARPELDDEIGFEPVEGQPDDDSISLTSGLALFSGHVLELNKTELRIIRSVMVKALDRALKAEFARVSAEHGVQVRGARGKRRKAVRKASARRPRTATAPTPDPTS